MKKTTLLADAMCLIFGVVSLQATEPARWTISEQREFLLGELKGISVTSDGKLILAPAFESLLETEEAFIYAAVLDNSGNLYLGTGNNGKIFRVTSQGRGAEWAQLDDPAIYALAVDSRGRLYAGTGPDGKVYRINDGGEAQAFFDPHEKYIWALAADEADNLLVATGRRGVIYKVDSQGEGHTFYDSKEAHITSLEWDLDGNLLAGTSPGGLLFRISSNGAPFVVYDSSLQEIKAITVDRYGNIYAAGLSRPQGTEGNPPPQQPPTPNGAPQQESESGVSGKVTVQISGTEKGTQLEIYKIDKENLVEILYSSNDELAFDLLVRSNGNLLVATGNKGRLISIDPRKFVTFLAEVPEQQITQLLERRGTIYAATSNLGWVFQLLSQPSSVGIYESQVLDAKMLSSWGVISWRMSQPSASSIKVYTRSGNTEVPDQTWNPWKGSYRDSGGSHIESAAARFLQWKMEFPAEGGTTSLTSQGNAVESVTISYIQRNMSPRVTSITVHPPGIAFVKTVAPNPTAGISPGGPDQAHIRSLPKSIRALGPRAAQPSPRRIYSPGAQSISWTGEDPNQDDLLYSVYIRSQDETSWKLMEKGLSDTYYTIDGVSLPDGVYSVKVVASDRISNPAQQALESELISKPMVIANASPVLELEVPQVEGDRTILKFKARTQGSVIHQTEYAVDAGEWNILFPEDGIADSDSEQYTLGIENIGPGEHAVTIRVVDSVGNIGTGKATVSIK
ncbi:hypothetical protein MYX82_08410 [Acidobacteria bacterium AH-259-D05]|nr:hypothetical protein [Acidobacteria bacterium AH-259-D05]